MLRQKRVDALTISCYTQTGQQGLQCNGHDSLRKTDRCLFFRSLRRRQDKPGIANHPKCTERNMIRAPTCVGNPPNNGSIRRR